jgi:hypothetical protein
MRHRAPQCLLAVATSALLAACGDTPAPTDPAASRHPAEPVMAAATTAAAALPTASNTWAPRATIESNYPFYGFTAAAAKNAAGQWIVYAFGGASDEGGGNWPILAYNVAANTWAPKHTRVGLSIRWNGVGLIGNLLYYSGGWTWDEVGAQFGNELEAYDFAADRKVTLANLPRFTADGITGVYQGKILYVLPGTCSGEGWPYAGYCDTEPFHRIYRYDPATNKWGTRTQSLYYHRGGAGAFVGNKFYVVGGQDATGASVNTWRLEAYDPTTNRWTARASMPSGGTTITECIGGVPCLFAAVLDQKLWVLTRDRRLLVYDPATNKWTAKAKLPAATFPEAMVRVAIGTQAYLFVIGAGQTPSQLYRP